MSKRARRYRYLFKIILFISSFTLLLLGVAIILFFILPKDQKQRFISPIVRKDLGIWNIEKKLLDANISFSSIHSFSSSYLVKLFDGEEIIFSSQKNIDEQISSLQPIIKQLTIEGRKFKKLDFRFDKPVIYF